MRLTANDWFLDAEMLIQCARLKLKMGEIPVTFDKCVTRESFVRIDAIFEFIKNLLRARIKEFLLKMNNQTILITGSEGKIGRYLLDEIKDKGYSVRALYHKGALKSESNDIDFSRLICSNPKVMFQR